VCGRGTEKRGSASEQGLGRRHKLWDTINLNEQSASGQGLAWSGSAVSEHLRNSWSASEQGVGRSRGGFSMKMMLTGLLQHMSRLLSTRGFSTKMVLTAIDENTPVAVEVLPSQVHEATQVEKMLDATQARLPQIEEAVADKGFDGEPQRQAMASRNIRPVIPYRVNRRNRGRLNRKAYAERNKIERLIGKLKEFRRIATRYDKLKETFLGIIQLALAYICLNTNLIVNRA
jgi:transposase